MSVDNLVSAQDGWRSANVLNRITSSFTGQSVDARAKIVWRPDVLTDFRDKRIPAAAVRLVRWDQNNPSTVFKSGFVPLQPNTASSVYDLYTFKVNKRNSVFVAATNCFGDRSRGSTTRWVPNSFETLARAAVLYEYDIFAYGGIDVDRSLVGLNAALREGDVAFPGGIRCQFIRSAMEYDAGGKPVRYWINGNFDPGVNGADHIPKPADLPPHIYPPDVHVAVWTENDETPNRPMPPAASNITGDAMAIFNGIQQPIHVEDAVNHPIARGAFLVPSKPDEAYFTSDTRIVRFRIVVGTGITDQPVLPASNIDRTFTALDKVGFASVDAALPNTGNNVWFFSGTQYVLVDVDADQLAFTPSRNIMERWNCLRQAAFETVDAVLPVPGTTEAYFFRGTKYVHVDFRQDTVLEGPANIATRFLALGDAGFTTIDEVLLVPNESKQLWVFSGTDYVRIPMAGDTILVGPRAVRTASLLANNFY